VVSHQSKGGGEVLGVAHKQHMMFAKVEGGKVSSAALGTLKGGQARGQIEPEETEGMAQCRA